MIRLRGAWLAPPAGGLADWSDATTKNSASDRPATLDVPCSSVLARPFGASVLNVCLRSSLYTTPCPSFLTSILIVSGASGVPTPATAPTPVGGAVLASGDLP